MNNKTKIKDKNIVTIENKIQLAEFGNKLLKAIEKVPEGCKATKITPEGNLLYSGVCFGLNCVGVMPIRQLY